MRYTLFDNQKDSSILVARILLVLLFVIFGWQKLVGFSGSVAYMTSEGLPAPSLAAVIAIVAELGLGIVIALGFWTRPAALLVGLYTIAAALIAHRYWTMHGTEQYTNMINFYKNLAIAGGLLLLAATGPGRYSIDGK
jgi:putative oxidoreductase